MGIPKLAKKLVTPIDSLLFRYRRATAGARTLPDFIIIGGQRCGSTSLYNLIVKHPNVKAAFGKEVHYFDNNYLKGESWYRANFPLKRKRRFVTGEASPYYIFQPAVPERIAELIPEVKLIALLRDPVARAYSSYNHEVRKNREQLPFREALAEEERRLAGEEEKLISKPWYRSRNHRRYGYKARGLYHQQLERWFKFFPSEQILVLKSEEFFSAPQDTMDDVFEFLDLPEFNIGDYPHYNLGSYIEIDKDLRDNLEHYFEEPNRALYRLIGRDLNW